MKKPKGSTGHDSCRYHQTSSYGNTSLTTPNGPESALSPIGRRPMPSPDNPRDLAAARHDHHRLVTSVLQRQNVAQCRATRYRQRPPCLRCCEATMVKCLEALPEVFVAMIVIG
jgi:hypothetical protein